MPTYEYRCDACGHEFELFQSMTDAVKRKCPNCAQLKLKRLVGTGAGIIFKGSGFYETDYRSDSYNKAAEAEKNAGSKSKGEKGDKPASTASDSSTGKADSSSKASESSPAKKPSSKKSNGKS